jgi:hypothetical protein
VVQSKFELIFTYNKATSSSNNFPLATLWFDYPNKWKKFRYLINFFYTCPLFRAGATWCLESEFRSKSKTKNKTRDQMSPEAIAIDIFNYFILPLLSAWDLDIGPEGWYQSRADDKGNMKKAMH